MLKKIGTMAACLAVVMSSGAVMAQDADGNIERKTELSEELHTVWGVRDDLKGLVDSIAEKIPAEKRSEFLDYMDEVMDYDAIQELSVNTAVETFTEAELEAMVDYYTSDLGQSAEQKKVRYNEALTPRVQSMMQTGMAKAVEEMNKKAMTQPYKSQ